MSANKKKPVGKAPGKRAQRGGIFGKMVKLLLFLATFAVADFLLTQRALQGQWQLEMAPNAEQHLSALMTDAQERNPDKQPAPGTLGAALKDRLRQGVARGGAKVLVAAASQVQVTVEGNTFTVPSQGGQAIGRVLSALAAERSTEEVECSRGDLLALFPFVRVTCFSPSEDRQVWFIFRALPGKELKLFPMPVGEREIRERAAQLQQSQDGKKPDLPSAETVEAITELFTLRLKKLPPTAAP